MLVTIYGESSASLIGRLKELELEKAMLKRIYANVCLQTDGAKRSCDWPFSIMRNCQNFNVSQTRCRYLAKFQCENNAVANSLIALLLCHSTWGFGLILCTSETCIISYEITSEGPVFTANLK